MNQAFDQAKTNLQNQINANKTAIETFANDYIAEKAAMELDYTTKIDNLRTMYEAKVVEIESANLFQTQQEFHKKLKVRIVIILDLNYLTILYFLRI